MSDDSSLIDAISARDATQIRDHLIAMDFYVLSIAAVDDEEQVAAMTAEVASNNDGQCITRADCSSLL